MPTCITFCNYVQNFFRRSGKYKPFRNSNDHSPTALEEPNLVQRLVELDGQDKYGRLQPLLKIAAAAETLQDNDHDKVKTVINDMKHYTREYQDQTEGKATTVTPTQCSCAEFPDDPTITEVVVSNKHCSPLFRNWGHTVKFQPSRTLVVRSIRGVQKIVKWAATQGKKVRVSGFRHSWSDIYGSAEDIIIMFLPYDSLVDLPYKIPSQSWVDSSELLGITIVGNVRDRTPPQGHVFVKIMAGTTNDQLRAWSFENKMWCIPFNVIMVEITFGGSNAPICHGSGLSSSTLSDLVVEVQYVDANGDLQVVNDPEELKVAAGAFGLLGVVVSLTLQLDTMGVTEMMPVKQHVALAIPPPHDYQIPTEVKKMMKEEGITDAQLKKAKDEFIQRVDNDYYLEWFWFPYQKQCWVNTWSKKPVTSPDINIESYPDDHGLDGVASQQLQGSLAQTIVEFPPFQWLSGQLQATILAKSAMLLLPDVHDRSKAIKTFVSEALHFRRGTQNFRCLDCEWEIPIPPSAGKRDYELIQRAWWDAISAIYSDKEAPVRLALEMRLTGGSNILLAPQRGNDLGTISIEALTSLTTPARTWDAFIQRITDIWTSYTDENGKKLNVRPHWAKQWSGLKVSGKDIESYLKEDAYAQSFVEFREKFEAILKARNTTLADTLSRFGTGTMERLIFQ